MELSLVALMTRWLKTYYVLFLTNVQGQMQIDSGPVA